MNDDPYKLFRDFTNELDRGRPDHYKKLLNTLETIAALQAKTGHKRPEDHTVQHLKEIVLEYYSEAMLVAMRKNGFPDNNPRGNFYGS